MYSQNQEELIIKNFFESPAGNLKPGTVLDIGANDGETLSNSRYLIQKGWEGVLVEPDAKAFDRLSTLYISGCSVKLFKIGIGDVDEVKTLYSVGDHLGKGDTGLLSSFNLQELQERFPGTPYEQEQVELMTWKTFIEHAPGPKEFNFITIDAESYDLIILKQINFNETKTSLVSVEWNSKDRHLYDQVMYPFGFRIIHLNGENIIYGR